MISILFLQVANSALDNILKPAFKMNDTFSYPNHSGCLFIFLWYLQIPKCYTYQWKGPKWFLYIMVQSITDRNFNKASSP